MSQKELQDKMVEYQMLEEKFKQLNERRELFTMRLMEIEQTEQAIEELKKSKGNDILVPLGSSLFLPGKIDKKEKLVIGIGADVALEKDVSEARKILEKRRKILEDGLENVQKNMLQIANQMRILEPEIQKMVVKSQQTG